MRWRRVLNGEKVPASPPRETVDTLNNYTLMRVMNPITYRRKCYIRFYVPHYSLFTKHQTGESMNNLVSVSPDGIKHPLPKDQEYERELERVQTLVAQARGNGQEIVVVMGLGFVGAV